MPPALTILTQGIDNTEETVSPTMAVDDQEREKLLDTFPFNEVELDHLLQVYNNSVHNNTNNELPSREISLSIFGQESLLKDIETLLVPESKTLIPLAMDNVFLLSNSDSTLWKYLETMASLTGRRGTRTLLQTIFDIAKIDNVVTAKALVDIVYRLILAIEGFHRDVLPQKQSDPPQSWVVSLSDHANGQSNNVPFAIWMDWVNTIAPQIYHVLSTYVHYAVFTTNMPFRSSTPFELVNLDTETGFWNNTKNDKCSSVHMSLSLLSPNLNSNKQWKRLYSSDLDGFSFPTFQESLLSYQGPTVVLIQSASNGEQFGFYTDTPWRTSQNWFGGGGDGSTDGNDNNQGLCCDSFIFGLTPTLRFYGPDMTENPMMKKKYFMFLNNPMTTSTQPGILRGLGIGGISDTVPRIHITNTFENCKAGAIDTTFTAGPLLAGMGDTFFDIDMIEAWAISSCEHEYTKNVQAGKLKADIREGNRIRNAQVDVKQFLDDFQSGQYMNNLYKHREETRGRHSFVADDNGRGYFIEENPPTPKETSSSSL